MKAEGGRHVSPPTKTHRSRESAALFERRALQLGASEQVDLVEGETEALDGRLVMIGRGQTFEL
jgi:hypothetical protein